MWIMYNVHVNIPFAWRGSPETHLGEDDDGHASGFGPPAGQGEGGRASSEQRYSLRSAVFGLGALGCFGV